MFEEYICDNYGMGKRSVCQENLVYDDMVIKLKCIDEAYEIERKITEKEIELKRLKIELENSKKLMLKSLNVSKRNYPEGIFITCVNVLQAAQDIIESISAVESVKHKPLMKLEGKAIVKTGVKRKSTNQRKIRLVKRLNWSMVVNEIKVKNDLNSEASRIGRIAKKVVPHWDMKKPGEIAVTIESERKVFELYEPSINPHPLQRYFMRVAG